VRTITNKHSTLPYADYVRILDTAAVNKYDLHRRLIKVIASCHGLVSLSLGSQPASVEIDFFDHLVRYCPQIEKLQLPDIEKCIFMQKWDLSKLKRLRAIELIAAPIDSSSITSISKCVESVSLKRLSLDNSCLEDLLKTHPYIRELVIEHCKNITDLFGMIHAVALESLCIYGRCVTDTTVQQLWSLKRPIENCSLRETNITDLTLSHIAKSGQALGRLDLTDSSQITVEGIRILLSASNPPKYVDITGCANIAPSQAEELRKGAALETTIYKRKRPSYF
jgi:hypothetical protein